MKKTKLCISIIIATLLSNNIYCQFNPLGTENSFIALDRQTGFLIMTGSAIGSYFVSKFLSSDSEYTFYQTHAGYYYGRSGAQMGPNPGDFNGTTTTDSEREYYNIIMENFGVEREYSRWFSLRLEANIQEFTADDYFTLGGGIKTYYKWTFMRKWMVHPFIEYGAGIFYALDKFPEDASNLTFNLNYAIGAEYILPNNNKIMLDFNFKHHSNNNLFENNPGFDGNGVSISYSWFWKEKGKEKKKITIF